VGHSPAKRRQNQSVNPPLPDAKGLTGVSCVFDFDESVAAREGEDVNAAIATRGLAQVRELSSDPFDCASLASVESIGCCFVRRDKTIAPCFQRLGGWLVARGDPQVIERSIVCEPGCIGGANGRRDGLRGSADTPPDLSEGIDLAIDEGLLRDFEGKAVTLK
jgi:hypothetical protein